MKLFIKVLIIEFYYFTLIYINCKVNTINNYHNVINTNTIQI